MELYQKLRDDAEKWRKEGYPCSDYPLIGEILRWQFEGEPQEQIVLKYLREPQFQSLEVYWYLRLVLKTPHIVDLYKYYYSDDESVFCDTLGIKISSDALRIIKTLNKDVDKAIDQIIGMVKTDDDFARENVLDTVYEAVMLDYPSYIFALAMGSGKTVLIGTIIATEFAMALNYPEDNFMKNALVFAPGKTIIQSLRELDDVPYERILPPGLYREFQPNFKITYPQEKAKDIPVQSDSTYNVIVTNTEKINLKADTKKKRNQTELEFKEAKDQNKLVANLRLQKITSLPNLGVFSDEAHHTYGNSIDKDLKRMRGTVNYINDNTSLIAVINTTGTPYYNKQVLREVVAWYSLGEGIEDNILKSLHDGIVRYDIGNHSDEDVIREIIHIFFQNYGDVALPNGAKAKIAFYFKHQDHLDESRRIIERVLTEIEQSPTLLLVHTQHFSQDEEFNRLNNPDSQKRIILLIKKGGEGWNCPSLFACALIKEQTSNIHVLQASTRCLRQVPGNSHPAKIFLDMKNSLILDNALEENFRTTLDQLSGHTPETEEVKLYICKTELPQLEITQLVRRVVRKGTAAAEIQLCVPTDVEEMPPIIRSILTPNFAEKGANFPIIGTGETEEVYAVKQTTTCYTLAQWIAANYHLPLMWALKTLKQLYPEGRVPNEHIYPLYKQVEKQLQNYEEIEEKVTEVLALIRIHDDDGNLLFEKDTDGSYFHRLRLLKRTLDRMKSNRLLFDENQLPDKNNVSFHYMPYDFDTKPERQFFEIILRSLNTSVRDVDVFLFTGALTDPKKTDFHFEYKGDDGNYHHYFPDFVIVKKTGEFYIIEIKSEKERKDETVMEKKKAVKRLENLQPNIHFKYRVIYTTDAFPQDSLDDIRTVQAWIDNGETPQTNHDENNLPEEMQ